MKGNSILVSPAILPDPRMRLAARQIHPFFNRDPTSSNLFQSDLIQSQLQNERTE